MNRTLALCAALAGVLGLSGCISVFPKSEPSTLYRLTAGGPAPTAQETGPVFTVLLGRTVFPRASRDDQILTTNGNETAYVAGARWATPAQNQFDEALDRAFDAATGVRLIGRGEASRADALLRVEVRTYEAQYRDGMGAPPTVVVAGRATLTRLSDRVITADLPFSGQARAADNRVGPIVEAYDEAVGEALGQITGLAQSPQAQTPAPAS
jgi:cholesterol transport system auxiliary component